MNPLTIFGAIILLLAFGSTLQDPEMAEAQWHSWLLYALIALLYARMTFLAKRIQVLEEDDSKPSEEQNL